MDCHHCTKKIQGQAHVSNDSVFHLSCWDAYSHAQAGFPYKCPECCGKGYHYTPGRWEDNGEMAGTIAEVRTWYVEAKKERCSLCGGVGWLEQEPRKVATGFRWEK